MIYNYSSDALQRLAQFGLPTPGARVRGKADVLVDTQTISSGTEEYRLFKNTSLSNALRNTTLPLSSDQIFYVNGIRLILTDDNLVDLDSNEDSVFMQSYLQVTVNSRVVLKVPLWECLSYVEGDTIGNSVVAVMNERFVNVIKKLKYPIVLNENISTDIDLVLHANAASKLDTETIRVELIGEMFDKIRNFSFNNVGDSYYNVINWTFYDTVDLTTTATSYELFKDGSKAKTELSGTFPISNFENFQIEAISFLWMNNDGSSAPDLRNLIDVLVQNNFEVNMNSVKFLDTNEFDWINFIMTSTQAFQDATPTSTNYKKFLSRHSSYVLPIPIIVPANSKTSFVLNQPVLTNYCDTRFMAMLKGTLTRTLQ